MKMNNAVIYFFGALGGLLFGYDTGVISGAILYIKKSLGLTPMTEGIVVSSILVGAIIGAAGSGRLSDKYGRRINVMIAAAIFCIGAIGTALAPNTAILILFRIVLGIAVGCASALVPLYLSEMAPAKIRGALSSLNQLMIVTGILIAYIVNYIFAPIEGWRWMLGLAFIPGVLLLIGMLFLPESPRWLLKQNREQEARKVLHHLRKGIGVEKELADIKKADAEEHGGWKMLKEKWVRPALIVGIGLAIFQQIIGCNTVIYYAPTTITKVGLGNSAALLGTIGIGILNVLVTILAVWLMDKVGRKKLLLIGSIGMAICLFALGLLTKFGGQSDASGYITLVCLAAYIVFFAATWGPVVWVMLGEIFPLRVRGLGIGISGVANWAANLLVSLTFPSLLDQFGNMLFIVYGVMGILAFIFVSKYVTETKGRSLEEIEMDLKRRSNLLLDKEINQHIS
ncbi:sugar porter (SP) family MFS transporter [Pullulanibacillus pueri]|uniref:Putative metabolite transport protein YwtG n=1 Tax=Pullulanibacillus pueri TaxID=1437324 RepID=A0A8J3EMG8_9BACL|nr:sugar porter family MFS transporter [Pullulanibacillus pueri]MBM7682235.1 sugar porter (SP) family MFS transporter [Pullulanibacillus pueri]GGH80557.1 putative metabolite transport protein YwtG [Pullulanibacillus pueri]